MNTDEAIYKNRAMIFTAFSNWFKSLQSGIAL